MSLINKATQKTTPTPNSKVSRPKAAQALAALGRLYVSQGRARQGLALLLSAQRLGDNRPELMRNIANALILAGAPTRAIPILDRLESNLHTAAERRAALYLRARALLAMGRVAEAQNVFAKRREIR